MLVFNDVVPIERKAAEVALASGDSNLICNALVAISFHDSDWAWVQEQCLVFLDNPNSEISGLAATCLGHVARIHGQLDKEKVVKALSEKLTNVDISGRVEDALDDIKIFCKK